MCRLFLMTIACLMVLFGISGLWMMPKLVQQKIEQRLQLKIGTKTFDRFTKVPIPLTVKFYLFNVTNSEQVLAGLERPQFQEVGPFMYKQWRRREIVDFEDYNRRLRYREIKTFYPMYQQQQPNANNDITSSDNTSKHNNSTNNAHRPKTANPFSASARPNTKRQKPTSVHNNIAIDYDNTNDTPPTSTPQTDGSQAMLDPHSVNVTIINVPLLSVLTKLALIEEGSLKRSLAARVASRLIADGNDKILITKPANELLFDGYRVDFMESARDLVSDTLGFNFDSPLPKNKFGFFFGKNGTWNRRENGELTVFTGRNDSMNDFMLVDNWNDQKQLSVWPTSAGNRCNAIKGTDGSQFHPGVTREQSLSIFSPMICTSLHIKYKEDTSCKDIPLLRFTTPAELFAAPKKNPQNACYCTIQDPPVPSAGTTTTGSAMRLNGSSSKLRAMGSSQMVRAIDDSRCYIDGLMDLSLCQRGAPIAASSPHFYNGDPMLAMAAGVNPRKELHETYIDIEPMTGAVMRAASRAQLNAYVERAALDVVDSRLIGNMTAMVAPLLWLEESAEIDERSSREFKDKLLNLVQKVRRSAVLAIVGGFLLALLVSGQYYYVTCYLPDHREPKSRLARAGHELSDSRRRQHSARKRLAPDEHRLGPRAARSGKQLRDNLLLGSDKRNSGLASKRAEAVGLGFVAGATAARALQRRAHERFGPADYEGGDDDESSKRRLVDWDPLSSGGAGTSGTSSGQSSQLGVSPAVHYERGDSIAAARNHDHDDGDDDDAGEEHDDNADLMRTGGGGGGSGTSL